MTYNEYSEMISKESRFSAKSSRETLKPTALSKRLRKTEERACAAQGSDVTAREQVNGGYHNVRPSHYEGMKFSRDVLAG